MDTFISRFSAHIAGVLSGFDRLVFRGSLIPLIRERGMYTFLKKCGVLLLDFKNFVEETSAAVVDASLAEATQLDRPVRYLQSSSISKEDLARRILGERPVKEGLICALKTVEPCMSFEYHRSQDKAERGLRRAQRKCLHVYKYFAHPTFGFLNVRLQTWFPFDVQICMNGREWLARQLESRGISFRKHDNCFTWLEDIAVAQQALTEQLNTDWKLALDQLARAINPLHDDIFKAWPMDYYWSAHQSEWATDVMFNDASSLAGLYPPLVRHAMNHFQSQDVMRFLGRKSHTRFEGELVSSFKKRPEGVRVKHWVDGNSIKMYDKAGSVLRVETTVANVLGFKVLRPLQNQPEGELAWRRLRKGIADLHRRAQVSQRSNEAYLEALSAVDDTTPLAKIFDEVSKPVVVSGRRHRALRIGDQTDIALLTAISRGEFATAGFRNRDLQRLLHPVRKDPSPKAKARISAKLGRQLRLLRAHGVIRKVPKSHRYRLTTKGHLFIAALLAARDANPKILLREAA